MNLSELFFNLYKIIYAVLCRHTLVLELVFHITLCIIVLCVECCITLGSAATVVYWCCAYCEENITITNSVPYLCDHSYGICISFISCGDSCV